MKRFERDAEANLQYGEELLYSLKNADYKIIDANIHDPRAVTIRVEGKCDMKLRKLVLNFLRARGYVKRTPGMSGTPFINTEDNNKRVFYGMEEIMSSRAEDLESAHIYLAFECR